MKYKLSSALPLLIAMCPCRYDRARGVEIGNKDIKLEYLEEAFTTSNWIVRIYKVKPPKNRW
jgi:dolichyl-diphosphooligosaccharide---protein glycosyltransferase